MVLISSGLNYKVNVLIRLCSYLDNYGKYPKILYNKSSDKMAYANSVDPDQSALSVWSGYTLFAIPLSILKKELHKKQTLSQKGIEILGHLPYCSYMDWSRLFSWRGSCICIEKLRKSKYWLRLVHINADLTLKAPITTIVVCFVFCRLL